MQLTRESEYALSGLAYLAAQPPSAFVPLADVATARDLPPSFLSKIFQKLTRHGLVHSERGPGNGYTLARAPSSITVLQVLEAVEGPRMLNACMLWAGHCADANPCPLHYRLKELVPALESALADVTLESFLARSNGGCVGA